MSKKNELVKLDVRITTARFVKDDYGVYFAELLNGDELIAEYGDKYVSKVEEITITGNFDKRFFYNEEYIMYAIKAEHKKYGVQYQVQLVQDKYDTPNRVKAFLKQFCQDSIVNQLMDMYGANVLKHISDNDVDYSMINGMGEYRFNALREKVMENEYMKDIIIDLGSYGITPLQMKKIIEYFGANATEKIEENPYILCKIHGIGFLKADDVALRMGYDRESENRIDEAVKFAIEEMQGDGNSWVYRKNLLNKVAELTGINKIKIDEHLENVPDIRIEDIRITLEKTYNAEQYIAEQLMTLMKTKSELEFDVEEFINEQEALYETTLTEEQKSFFYNVKKSPINLLVGYAGCGKSFLQKMYKNLAKKLQVNLKQYISIAWMAPTGKASKVLAEYTGDEAFTIHRKLAVGTEQDEKNPSQIYEHWIVVDEVSMADIYIIQKLLKAVEWNPNVRILFVGDNFQIPSVGVGNFLTDCLDGGLPTTKLTQVFRQAEGGVLDVATKIRLGEVFLENDAKGKIKFGKDMVIHCLNQSDMESRYINYYKGMSNKFNIDDIVVLSCTKKGNLGTVAINTSLQEVVNPPSEQKEQVQSGQLSVYRVGDRVLNIQNYRVVDTNGTEHMIVNGDTGVILEVNHADKYILIDYGFARIRNPFSRLDKILLVYCMTMHKSQGSGYPVVIIVADKAHKWQLNANLLYTALTRTKQYCILLTQPDVINSILKKNVNLQRNTFLKEMLLQLS